MAVKWSVPGIRFKEIDNTIQNNADPGLGIGAIVIKANKGPVNQRILSKTYNEFTSFFGDPEALDDYGHFAAENYLAVSNQLMAVRATMGDEQYAQIQYSYNGITSIEDTNVSTDTKVFKFVDGLEDNNLKLLQPLSGVTNVSSLTKKSTEKHSVVEEESDQEWEAEGADTVKDGYVLRQKAHWATFKDIKTESDEVIVYKDSPNDVRGNGVHMTYPSLVDKDGNIIQIENNLMFTDEAYNSGSAAPDELSFANTTIGEGDEKGVKVSFFLDESETLDGNKFKVSFVATQAKAMKWMEEGVAYKDMFTSDAFYPSGTFEGLDKLDQYTDYGYGRQTAEHLELTDWEDIDTPKTYYIDTNNPETGLIAGQASSIVYQEYGMEGDRYAIIGRMPLDDGKTTSKLYYANSIINMYSGQDSEKDPTEEDAIWLQNRKPKTVCYDLVNTYGLSDVSDIIQYYYVVYFDILNQTLVEKLIKKEATNASIEDYLFRIYAEQNATKITKQSIFTAEEPEFAKLPIQSDFERIDKIMSADDTEVLGTQIVKVNEMNALPSSYLFSSTDKTYVDGYTVASETEDEPGIGDIEKYESNFNEQFIIASIGPGKYGNDVGVSIITTECSEIPALQHQNAFNWKYLYDDEDLVRDDAEDYQTNTLDLTWKKVFRINVYVKEKTQTAKAAWGTGMSALLKDPVESFMVSTNPYVKDANGNSLYAPTVVNGHSDYIYISRSSVAKALNAQGEYCQPYQTYAIYQLTGGKNSSKNNIKEKTACLSLYTDRQKANFDILFNVDAIENFSTAPGYMAHQKKIAEIAASRTMDIGVVQTTSKAAKTAKQMLNEVKSFQFNNGTYVAEYGNYDKYYNGTLGSWIYLPKSVAGACAMAYCDNAAYPWMAPAGVQRGGISYTSGQLKRLTDDEIGQLYDQLCNTSRMCGGFGEVLWGQKTALKKTSALNRINVRRCLNYIEKNLENALTPYLFQQNTPNTRASAKNVIDSFLERVKAAEGILSYSTSVTQDGEDAHILNVNIHVVPAEAIEFIDVKINVDRETSTVTVSE